MNRSLLISFASNFISYLFQDENVAKKISKIILFGSVASGEFDDKSDIDLFIDTSLPANYFQKRLELYNKSEDAEKYRLQGIKNEISLKVGKLKEWASLRRAIISNGLTFFGKYEELPKDTKQHALFTLSSKGKRSEDVKLWRKLYGYTQKVGQKEYTSNGLVIEYGGKKLAPALFIVPIETSGEITTFLKKNKVNYNIIEIWGEFQ